MLKDIEDISKRLVEQYDPDRIILFGSRAEGKNRKNSDVDLVIVKETSKRPIERRIEVETLLADREIPLDIIVYTAGEMRYLYSIGSPFIEEVVHKGRIVYMRKATAAWVKDAREDLESSKVLYDHEKYKPSCYHSQQAVEKSLKAIIIEKGKKPERTHDVVELYNRVGALGFETGLSMDDVIYVNSIYKGRYPTEEGLLPHGDPSKEEAEKAIDAASRLLQKLESLTSGS